MSLLKKALQQLQKPIAESVTGVKLYRIEEDGRIDTLNEIRDTEYYSSQTRNRRGPNKAWHDFNKAASQLREALQTVSVESGGPDERPSNALNFEQISDIEYTLKGIQEQIDRLDKRYDWREYMSKKRERVFGSK